MTGIEPDTSLMDISVIDSISTEQVDSLKRRFKEHYVVYFSQPADHQNFSSQRFRQIKWQSFSRVPGVLTWAVHLVAFLHTVDFISGVNMEKTPFTRHLP